ncbi:MAG: DnaJ domain-containing protein [Betaproteobacteria bacterium]|nr:DnaJ domain-containing protein [Betaproteobacteria bacterium]
MKHPTIHKLAAKRHAGGNFLKFLFSLGTGLILSFSPVAEAQVYKCQSNGTTQYSDRDCGPGAERMPGTWNPEPTPPPKTEEENPVYFFAPSPEKETSWFENWSLDWEKINFGPLWKNRLLWKFLILFVPLLIWWMLHVRFRWTRRWRDRRRRFAWGWGIAGALIGSLFEIGGIGGFLISGAIPGALIGFFVASNFMKEDFQDIVRYNVNATPQRRSSDAPRKAARKRPAPNYYDLLQISRKAGPEVIQGAFRYLAQRWHPDKNPGNREEAERMFKMLNEAHSVLSDPKQKTEYDKKLDSGETQIA